MLAQKHGEGDRGHHQQNPKKKGKASSYAHGENWGMIAEPRGGPRPNPSHFALGSR
jgi:hypothetical protein